MAVVVPWAASNPGYHALGSILTKLSTIVSLQHHFKDNINSLQNKFHNTLVSLQHHFNCRKTPHYNKLSLTILLSNSLSILTKLSTIFLSLQLVVFLLQGEKSMPGHHASLHLVKSKHSTFYNTLRVSTPHWFQNRIN